MSFDVTDPQLLIFDTLTLQQDPRSWRILRFPQLPYPRDYSILARCGDSLGEYPKFLVDPTQMNSVLFYPRVLALVVLVELLIRRMDSGRASTYVLWNDWGEGVVTIHLHPDAFTLQLVDTKVSSLRGPPFLPEGWGVEMYPLGRQVRRVFVPNGLVKGKMYDARGQS